MNTKYTEIIGQCFFDDRDTKVTFSYDYKNNQGNISKGTLAENPRLTIFCFSQEYTDRGQNIWFVTASVLNKETNELEVSSSSENNSLEAIGQLLVDLATRLEPWGGC